jgi:hypothetical protein
MKTTVLTLISFFMVVGETRHLPVLNVMAVITGLPENPGIIVTKETDS